MLSSLRHCTYRHLGCFISNSPVRGHMTAVKGMQATGPSETLDVLYSVQMIGMGLGGKGWVHCSPQLLGQAHCLVRI